MARASAAKAGGTSHIRVVMIEADLAEGELPQLIPALQNALRSSSPPIQRLPSPAPKTAPRAADAPQGELDLDQPQQDSEFVDAVAEALRPRAARKAAPKPNVIQIDIASEPPLSSLVDPKSNHRRYLAIAAWLHDHRTIEAITADHIYTCYRHLGWPTDILDFAQPLRELKHKQYFTTPERGKYAINQLGLAKAAEAAFA
jgi:hypothetical protein